MTLLLQRRWPNDPHELRTFEQLRKPICMQLVLELGPKGVSSILLQTVYNLITTHPAFKSGSVMLQHATLVACLREQPCATFLSFEAISLLAIQLDHYIQHGLRDTGHKHHDDCYEMLNNLQTARFERLHSVCKSLHFMWVIHCDCIQHDVTLLILSYIETDPDTFEQECAYNAEPEVSSYRDFIQSTELENGKALSALSAKMFEIPKEVILNRIWTNWLQTTAFICAPE